MILRRGFRLIPSSPSEFFNPRSKASSLLSCCTLRSYRSYRKAAAGVKAKEPATMTPMKGRPKRRNGCRESRARYSAPSRSPSEDDAVFDLRKVFDWKTGIFCKSKYSKLESSRLSEWKLQGVNDCGELIIRSAREQLFMQELLPISVVPNTPACEN